MDRTFNFTHYLYRGRNEREFRIEVTYSVSPYVAATWTQPAEGGEIEVLSVTGVDYTTRAEGDLIHTACCDRADEDLAIYAADRDEWIADQRRDDRIAA